MSRLFAFAAAALLAAVHCVSAPAAIVMTTLTLDSPPSNGVNRIDLSLFAIMGNVLIPLDNAVTDLSGNIVLELDMNESNVVTSFRILGGSFAATDWTMTVPDLGDVSAENTGGTFATTIAPPSSTVTASSFAPADHELVINTGILDAPGEEDDVDFVTDPVSAGGDDSGIGTLTLTDGGSPNQYDVYFELPIASINFLNDEETLRLDLAGNIIARGSVTAVPEPSAALALAAFGAIGAVRARRRRGKRGASVR